METCLGDYNVDERPTWRGYSPRHDWTTATYSKTSSYPVETANTSGQASVEELLSEVLQSAFCSELVGLRQGREALTFSKSPLLKRLQAAFVDSSDSRGAVEELLTKLFLELKPDQEFEHTEIVMALLFAMHAAEVSFFSEIATVLANSRAAEIGRLSRYAQSLLV